MGFPLSMCSMAFFIGMIIFSRIPSQVIFMIISWVSIVMTCLLPRLWFPKPCHKNKTMNRIMSLPSIGIQIDIFIPFFVYEWLYCLTRKFSYSAVFVVHETSKRRNVPKIRDLIGIFIAWNIAPKLLGEMMRHIQPSCWLLFLKRCGASVRKLGLSEAVVTASQATQGVYQEDSILSCADRLNRR